MAIQATVAGRLQTVSRTLWRALALSQIRCATHVCGSQVGKQRYFLLYELMNFR